MADVIRVSAERRYDVAIGRGLLDQVPGMVDGARRVCIIHPEVMSAVGARLGDGLGEAGVEVHSLTIPDAEGAKTAAVLESCWTLLGAAGFTRSDAIIGLGGGATTDLAGFAAATWLRGIRVLQIPTTLLGMVDAAIGGKTVSTPPPARTSSAPSTVRVACYAISTCW